MVLKSKTNWKKLKATSMPLLWWNPDLAEKLLHNTIFNAVISHSNSQNLRPPWTPPLRGSPNNFPLSIEGLWLYTALQFPLTAHGMWSFSVVNKTEFINMSFEVLLLSAHYIEAKKRWCKWSSGHYNHSKQTMQQNLSISLIKWAFSLDMLMSSSLKKWKPNDSVTHS